jgi:transcriptional regulator of aromatic amino acid metabolism
MKKPIKKVMEERTFRVCLFRRLNVIESKLSYLVDRENNKSKIRIINLDKENE